MSLEDRRREVDELVDRVGRQRRQLRDAGRKLDRLRQEVEREMTQGPFARERAGSPHLPNTGAEG